MAIYLYDGSFNSLVSVSANLISSDTVPENILTEESANEYLFGDKIFLPHDNQFAERVCGAFEKQRPEVMSIICADYLSDTEGSEMIIYNLFRAIKEKGYDAIDNYADERVLSARSLSSRVYGESHRLLGLLRFSELSDGTFYAPFEPDHNLVGLVSPHFARRLAKQDWIIHDLKRGICSIYKKREKRWFMFNIEESSPLEYSDEELEYRKMWKRYYREIAIPERINPACQKRFMPVRYWKHLTERQAR